MRARIDETKSARDSRERFLHTLDMLDALISSERCPQGSQTPCMSLQDATPHVQDERHERPVRLR
jgi:hypothetical protein